MERIDMSLKKVGPTKLVEQSFIAFQMFRQREDQGPIITSYSEAESERGNEWTPMNGPQNSIFKNVLTLC